MYLINGLKEILANKLNRNYRNLDAFPLMILAGDHIGTRILLNGYYENEQLANIVELLQLNNYISGVFLDIGANIGNHSIFFAPYFQKVIAIEADNKIHKILLTNIELNKLTHVHAVNVAASDAEGSISFASATQGNLGTGKVIQNENPSSPFINSIRAMRIDDLLLDYENIKVNFIKLDIEGHEYNALSGLINTINRSEPLIAFEANDLNSFVKVKNLLSELGYRKFYSLQFPFASYPKLVRVPFRMLINAKRQWVEITKIDRSCINDLVICSKTELQLMQ
jgi:FkbM family methyltransferase